MVLGKTIRTRESAGNNHTQTKNIKTTGSHYKDVVGTQLGFQTKESDKSN